MIPVKEKPATVKKDNGIVNHRVHESVIPGSDPRSIHSEDVPEPKPIISDK